MQTLFKILPTIVYVNPEQDLQIIRAELTNDLSIAIDLINLSDQVVSEVSFAIIYKDQYENYLFNGAEFYYDFNSINCEAHKIYYIKPFPIDDRFKDARAIEIRIKDMTFLDGKNHKYNKDLERAYTLPLMSETKREQIKDLLGPEINSYGENTTNGWRCVCGVFNNKEVLECRYCSRNKNFVLNNLTEPLINIKILNFISKSEDYDLEKTDSLKMNLTQTQFTKIAESENLIEKTRINKSEESSNKSNNPSNKIVKTLSTILIIVLILGFSYVSYNMIQRLSAGHNFEKAKAELVAGDYKKALSGFKSLKKYGKFEVEPLIEKTEKLIASKDYFERGNELILKNKYLDALSMFKKIPQEDIENFSKSQDKISQLEDIVLSEAESLIESDKKNEALNLIRNYLKIIPESAKAQSLEDLLNNKTSKTKNQVFSKEDKDLDKTRAEMSKKAENLIHTYQKILAPEANLRVSPSIDSDVIRVFPAGSELYIKEVKIEGTERIWCKVEIKAPDEDTSYQGWISNKLIESKQ